MELCCTRFNWAFKSNQSHADGVEFTYGRCTSCNQDLIHLHVPVANSSAYVAVDPEFVDEMLSLEGKVLKEFMREWNHSL